MGWKRALRSMEAQVRRQERESRRRFATAQKAWKEAQKAQTAEAGRLEVETFEAHIDELSSLHRECVEPIDWAALVKQPPPKKPEAPGEVERTRSSRAKLNLARFQPTLLERLFGST